MRFVLVVVTSIILSVQSLAAWSEATSIYLDALAGRTWFDLNGDQVFEVAGGDGPTTSAYVFATDTRLDQFNDVIRVWRSGLEFDLNSVVEFQNPSVKLTSAHLSIHFFIAKDLINFPPPDFGPPRAVLHAYNGDGVVSSEDMAAVNSPLATFSPVANSPIQIDITSFIQALAADSSRFASFMLQVQNDYERGNLADAYYGSRHLADAQLRPRLIFEFVQVVGIDIKPGSDPNCFNVNGHGVIPVAILGEETFDVATIDVDSLLFGGLQVRQRKGRALCSVEDVNDDAYWDLVCHFENVLEDWVADEDEATLTGTLYDETEFEGTDSICLVPKGGKT